MAVTQLQQEDHARDAAFQKAMHGRTAVNSGGLRALLGKDHSASKAASDDYWKHWDQKPAENETQEDRANRRAEYASLTRHYYNLATDLYEYGWGTSFHFCRFAPGEPFYQAIARHEHYLAHSMGLRDGMKVLDVGCGVGGPATEICRFANVDITGLNNNDYQIARATGYAAKAGLESKLRYVKGDFMQMSFPDNSFDAVYAIEATVHAPSLEGIYSEIYRVLKPGGTFGVYEWLMTDEYDDLNPAHRKIRLDIETGDGISNMVKIPEALKAMKAAGFQMELNEDLADRPDRVPWYYPLAGDLSMMGSIWDFPTIFRMTKLGRTMVHGLVGLLETVGFAPKGSQKMADGLALAGDALVAGGKQHLFTPMYLVIAKKPQ